VVAVHDIRLNGGGSGANGFEEYVSEDGLFCKQIWDDGYIEIFKIAK